ncbi:dynein light chain Tctex-type 5-like [Biomphalaria glabrata]|uniref:Dynein light chain Tctex-type 5-like n=1 Tax=Biomphalaria glabrata TaxID=6526 RepID=A0A2C9LQU8_BIOGL|nr:dynein light chain Tctex-type 5-like [Biomphalaria glabrata]KAI8784565.1 tctex1 domain-containing protein 1 [Biomphalaria glabrata]
MSKAGSLAERKLESSMDHSNSAKFRAGRLRLKMRMLSHLATSTIASQPSYVAYENTYKMVSDEGKQFSVKKAEEVILGVFGHYLTGKTYDPKVFPRLSKNLTELIRDRVKALGIERYKLLTTVTLLENKSQGVQLASRALWNQQLDTFASASFQGPNYFAVGTVYAIYHD